MMTNGNSEVLQGVPNSDSTDVQGMLNAILESCEAIASMRVLYAGGDEALQADDGPERTDSLQGLISQCQKTTERTLAQRKEKHQQVIKAPFMEKDSSLEFSPNSASTKHFEFSQSI